MRTFRDARRLVVVVAATALVMVAASQAFVAANDAPAAEPSAQATTPFTIILDALPNNAQDIPYTMQTLINPTPVPFVLDDDLGAVGGSAVNPNARTFNVPQGTFVSFQAQFVAGWSPVSAVCNRSTVPPSSISQVTLSVGTTPTTCTFTTVKRQPDAQIKNPADPRFAGDNIYGGSLVLPSQTKTQAVARGRSATFHLRFQNDSVRADSFRIKGPVTAAGVTVKYFSGATDVTNIVALGTKSSGALVPGALTPTLIMQVTVARTASVGTRSFNVSATSVGAPTAKDQVTAKVIVT